LSGSTAAIVRLTPRRDSTNVEPNYLVAVDFDEPDLPWLLTPAAATHRAGCDHGWRSSSWRPAPGVDRRAGRSTIAAAADRSGAGASSAT
jgi:hypothetical protein